MSQAEISETHHGPVAPEAVVGTLARTGDGWTAPLLVDLSHPFFFDHPLDHVSGIQIICGVLDMVTKLSGEPLEREDRRLLVDLRFRGICDLAQPTRLDVTTGDGYGVRAAQNGVTITEGEFHLVDGVRAAPVPAGGQGDVVELCAQELVHRHRIENVVLGAPVEDAEGIVAPLIRPSTRHYLGGFGEGRYSTRGLIEASRQFFTVLLHRAAAKPMAGVTTFWMWLGADIPCSPANDTALAFRWQRVAHKGTRINVGFDLMERDSGAVVGRFDYHAVAVSTAAYQRFRARPCRASDAGGPGAKRQPTSQ